MTRLCKECGGQTAWEDDAGSDICTQCGTLSDPSQTLLTHTTQTSETAAHLWGVPGYATLKSRFNQSSNWDLPGQGKEVHDRRNHLSMTHFINSLCISINAPGLSPRATVIFNQAMATGKFRWGRRAKLVAGASLAVALREYRRPDSLNDIAYLLDEHYPILVRMLTTLVSLLNISLTPVDPSVHIPPLHTYLSSLSANVPSQLQSEPTPQLHASLIYQLKSISLRAASNTAVALSTCLARLGPDHAINSLPSPPTAIALFLLAIEADLRTPLDHLGELAECLGARCHKSSRGVVMARYKLIQDEIATWIEQVPWLGKYEQRFTKSGINRAKTSKRTVVARGIADVLQFQEGIWKNKSKPTFTLDVDDADEDDADDTPERATPESATRPNKRQKVAHPPLRDAAQFLLDPATSPLPKYEFHIAPVAHSQVRDRVNSKEIDSSDDHLPQGCNIAQQPLSVAQAVRYASQSSLPAYILTAPELPTPHKSTLPTRLQILTAMRGAEKDIDDDELFEEDELERMLRTSEEANKWKEKLIRYGIWEENTNNDGEEDQASEKKHRQRKTRSKNQAITESFEDGEIKKRKSRVDLDALARFMESPVLDADDELDQDEHEKERSYSASIYGLEDISDEGCFGLSYDADEREYHEDDPISKLNASTAPSRTKNVSSTPAQIEDELVLSEWRPLSPEAGFDRPGRYDEYN